jgi:hypothetical protein
MSTCSNGLYEKLIQLHDPSVVGGLLLEARFVSPALNPRLFTENGDP